MRTSKFSPRIRGELEGGKIKPVSFSTKASGIVKYLEKPKETYVSPSVTTPAPVSGAGLGWGCHSDGGEQPGFVSFFGLAIRYNGQLLRTDIE